MLDEENEIAFVMWTAETANASRDDWNVLSEGGQDKWRRMARVAIARMHELRIGT